MPFEIVKIEKQKTIASTTSEFWLCTLFLSHQLFSSVGPETEIELEQPL